MCCRQKPIQDGGSFDQDLGLSLNKMPLIPTSARSIFLPFSSQISFYINDILCYLDFLCDVDHIGIISRVQANTSRGEQSL